MNFDFNILIFWLIRFGYLLITLICVICAFKPDSNEPYGVLKYRLKWWIITTLIIIIGIDSLFHLHMHLTGFMREYALKEGWYSNRGQYQMLFVAGGISFGVVTIIMLQSTLSGFSNNIRRILYGVTFLGTIILIDLVSFHPVDQLFKNKILSCNVRLVLEFTGIIWIAVSLIIKIYQDQKKPPFSKGNSRIRFV